MQQWAEHRNEFLDALLWLDGCGNSLLTLGCPICASPGVSGTFRCDECFGLDLVCQACCLQRHKLLPLHRVKVSIRSTLFGFTVITLLTAVFSWKEVERQLL
jgi:hypothetical protein